MIQPETFRRTEWYHSIIRLSCPQRSFSPLQSQPFQCFLRQLRCPMNWLPVLWPGDCLHQTCLPCTWSWETLSVDQFKSHFPPPCPCKSQCSTHSSCCIFTMPSATLSIKLQVYGTLREQRQHEESLTPPWGKPVYILKQNEWRPLTARVHQVGPPFDNALLRLQFWWAVLTNSSAAPLSWAAPVCHDFRESCSHPYFPYTALY